jgi:hypothetical protein
MVLEDGVFKAENVGADRDSDCEPAPSDRALRIVPAPDQEER